MWSLGHSTHILGSLWLVVRMAGRLRLGAGDGLCDGAGVSVFPAAVLDDALDAPAVGGPEHVVGVGAAEQVELAVGGSAQQVLGVHVGVADGPVGIAGVELDDVVGADVLGGGEPVEGGRDPRHQVRAGDGGGGGAAAGEVGVDGVGETAGEHGPVAPVDADRVPDHLLADLRAVFDLADAGFEVGRHGGLPEVVARLLTCQRYDVKSSCAR